MSSNEATGQPRSSPVESESALGLEPASLGALAIGVIAIGLLTRRSPTLSDCAGRPARSMWCKSTSMKE